MFEILMLSWFGGMPNFFLGTLYGFGFGLVQSRVKKLTMINVSFTLVIFCIVTAIPVNSYLTAAQLSFINAFEQFQKSQFGKDAISTFMLGLGAVIGFLGFVAYWYLTHKKQPYNLNVPS